MSLQLKLALAGLSLLSLAATSKIGVWEYQEVVDQMTDFRRPIASVMSEDGYALVVKCDGGGRDNVYIQIIAPQFLGGGGLRRAYRKLMFRFDDYMPEEGRWGYGDRDAVLTAQDAAPFSRVLYGLHNSSELKVRLTRYDGSQFDTMFKLSGAGEQVDRVLSSCGKPNG